MTWYDAFKKTLSENTIANPLDSLFPGARKKITGENPPPLQKETSLTTKIKGSAMNTINKISNFGKDFSFFAVIVLAGVTYLFFKKEFRR